MTPRYPNSAGVYSPSWSPDGQNVLFWLDGELIPKWEQMAAEMGIDVPPTGLYVVSADGSQQLRYIIGSDSFVGGISWSPDGTRIAFSAATSYPQGRAGPIQLWMAHIDGTNARNLTNLGGHDCLVGVTGRPSWSPDSTQIVFFIAECDTSQVYLINADGTGMRQVTFEGNNCCPTWAR